MERTDSLKIVQLAETLAGVGFPEPGDRRIADLARRLIALGTHPEAVAAAALDGLVELLGFERGFLIASVPGDPAAPSKAREAGDVGGVRVLAARALKRRDSARGGPLPGSIHGSQHASRPGTKDPEFEDLPNPDFAINRAAAWRALQSPQAFAVPDCLIPPHPGGPEVHRSLLCQPFAASPGRPAALYLDRGPVGEPVLMLDLAILSEFNDRCLPLLKIALLSEELLAARARRPAPAGDGDAEGAGEEADDGAEESGIPDSSRLVAAAEAIASTALLGGGAASGSGLATRGAAAGHDAEAEPLPPAASIPLLEGMVGGSEKMRRIFQIIERIKDSDLSVCIFGESGTGKELVARAIHRLGRRREKPFVSENCGTIAETLLESELFGHQKGSFTGADEDKVGLFASASGGTLLLDEIGDMSEGMQRKLLRVLQEGVIRPIGSRGTQKVDARIICASNRNLPAMVKSGAFRVDLFYRINVITIEIPPLRERLEELAPLASYFLSEIEREEGAAPRLSRSAMNAFREYSWPGNVRELRNVLRRAAVTATRRAISRKDVAPLLIGGEARSVKGEGLERSETGIVLHLPRRATFHEIIGECERVVLLNALKECRWNKSKVVKSLKIPRQSLYNMIAKHGLERKWEE